MIFWEFFQRIFALCILVILSPFLLLGVLLVFFNDRKNPFYTPLRVGKNGTLFSMIKLRTMVYQADQNGVIATAASDARITAVGRYLRPLKFDEFFQLINVIKGDMLLIGPRPQLISEYQSFTEKEKGIVRVKPGMSDFASLFLSKMEFFLSDYADPYQGYFHVCRPIKSRLALFYAEHRSVWIDIQLLFLNATNFLNHRWTLRYMAKQLAKMGDCGIPYEILSGEKPPVPMDLPR